MKKEKWKRWETLGMAMLFLGYGITGTSSVVLLNSSNNITLQLGSFLTLIVGILIVIFGYYSFGDFFNKNSKASKSASIGFFDP